MNTYNAMADAPDNVKVRFLLPNVLLALLVLVVPPNRSKADYILDVLDASAPAGDETREIVILPGDTELINIFIRAAAGDSDFTGFVFNWQLSDADVTVSGSVDIPNPPFDPATWIVDTDAYDFDERSFGATSLDSLAVPGGEDPTQGLLLASIAVSVAPGTSAEVVWFDLLGPTVPVNGPSGIYDALGGLNTPASGVNLEDGRIRIFTPEPSGLAVGIIVVLGLRRRCSQIRHGVRDRVNL